MLTVNYDPYYWMMYRSNQQTLQVQHSMNVTNFYGWNGNKWLFLRSYWKLKLSMYITCCASLIHLSSFNLLSNTWNRQAWTVKLMITDGILNSNTNLKELVWTWSNHNKRKVQKLINILKGAASKKWYFNWLIWKENHFKKKLLSQP